MVNTIKSLLLIFTGLLLALTVIELTLRMANLNQNNYVIEMWKYANYLKRPSEQEGINNEHVPNRSRQLQGVTIAINSLGLRGPEPQLDKAHRIAILGDSAVLGWGVEEENTLRARLQSLIGEEVDVVNAGVGNMNLANVVAHWQKISEQLDANTLLLSVSPRATEDTKMDTPGFLLRYSQLAAIVVTNYRQFKANSLSSTDLKSHYKQLWNQNNNMLEKAFTDLKQAATKKNQRVIVFMLPETHDFINYEFDFMHERIEQLSKHHGFDYLDGLILFKGQEANNYWVSEQDIHLNGQANLMIAETIYQRLQQQYFKEMNLQTYKSKDD